MNERQRASVEIRPITPDEYETFFRVFTRALGFSPPTEEEREARSATFLWDRSLAAFDAGEIVGTAYSFPTDLTLPGGATARVAAVTAVSVAATHRRQGVANALMRQQLAKARQDGEPAAILLASESLIYGRFGYGLAASALDLDIDRRHGAFARPPAAPGRVRFISDEDAYKINPGVFDRFRRRQPGAIERDSDWWMLAQKLSKDPPATVVYESPSGEVDGYARYKVRAEWAQGGNPEHRLDVQEIVSVTDDAHEALWHHVLNVDLVTAVHASARPAHERLRWLLADPRRMRTRALRDFLWLRPLDPAELLARRTYRCDGDLALMVADAFLPDVGGTFVVHADDGGATSRRADDAKPDLVMDAADLGAIVLGGVAPSELAAAGRIHERREGALALADLMFGSSPPPWCNTGF